MCLGALLLCYSALTYFSLAVALLSISISTSISIRIGISISRSISRSKYKSEYKNKYKYKYTCVLVRFCSAALLCLTLVLLWLYFCFLAVYGGKS